MAFKRIRVMNIWEILRRWQARHSLSSIAEALGYDRGTVSRYVELIRSKGIAQHTPINREEALVKLSDLEAAPQRPSPAREVLQLHVDEITQLLQGDGLKMKTAYQVLCQRHTLGRSVSLSSFERFVYRRKLLPDTARTTCRLEGKPGREVQIDYAKMGCLEVPGVGRKTVYAFIATLCYSRHKYVEFVVALDQMSFIASNVRMFEYFGGVMEQIVIDNLKTGVLKADLYNPTLNHAYQEMAEHYKCFIDPARVASPRDKGKVERDVQTIREQFKKFLALYPDLDLAKANRLIVAYLKDEYGQTEHGTTRSKPVPVFREIEQPFLNALPVEPFVIAQWKEVSVHPDCYIQFNKKSYSVPYTYVGQKLWARSTANLLQVYDQRHTLVKQHVLTSSVRQTDWADFPDNVRAALDEGVPRHLQTQAAGVGEHFQTLIRRVLQPHAFLNLRRAQGLVKLSEHWDKTLIEEAAQIALKSSGPWYPKPFQSLLCKLKERRQTEETFALVGVSQDFVRESSYFEHPFLNSK